MEKVKITIEVAVDTAVKIMQILQSEENTAEPTVKAKSAPKAEKKTPAKEAESVTNNITLDDVRHAFAELSDAQGNEAAKQILADMGYKRVTAIPEEDFEKALEKVKEAME